MLERHPSNHVSSILTGGECIGAYQAGEWRRALDLARQTAREVAHETTATWLQDSIDFWATYSLYYRGELRELAQSVPVLLRQANMRGDLYGATNLRVGLSNAAWLVADNITGARNVLDNGIAQWTARWFHLQHYHSVLGECQFRLYGGGAEEGLAMLRERWPAINPAPSARRCSAASPAVQPARRSS